MADALIGIDLGGTRIKTVVVSPGRDVLARDVRETPATEGPDVVADAMAASARAALATAGDPNVLAVGAGAPGPMNWKTGEVYSPPNLTGWRNVPLAEMLHDRLGAPCFVDNDANLACYGEFWMGAGQGVQSMCMLTLGTGVGGGIVLDGKLLHGIDGTAAEIGHLTVQRDGRLCGCGAKGCLETYASVTGLVRTARERIDAGEGSCLIEQCDGNLDRLTGKMISEAAGEGDALARWAIEETGEWIGVGLSSLINLLNPEKIVLGGGMIGAGDRLIDVVRRRAGEDAFETPAKRARILPAQLADDAGAIGAAAAAHDRMGE